MHGLPIVTDFTLFPHDDAIAGTGVVIISESVHVFAADHDTVPRHASDVSF